MDRIKVARWPLAILVFASVLALASCRSTQGRLNVAGLAAPYEIEITEPGRPTTRRTVVPGSSDEQAIIRWLAAHEAGWQPDFNSYVPGHRIKGDRFDLNYHAASRLCVLNHDATGQGGWRQVSMTLPPADAPPPGFEAAR